MQLMKRVRDIQRLSSANGFLWTTYFVSHHVLRLAMNAVDARMSSLEKKHGLPGFNSVARNRYVWSAWNWSQLGEEWTISDQWKQALIDDVLLKYIGPSKTILEIGPGGGRWTEALQKIAQQLIVVDLSDTCIELCKRRFAHCTNIEYVVNNGTDLSCVPSKSIDYVWSFDVFVHISPQDTDKYLGEISRVLRDGGQGVIHHHGAGGDMDTGWRSKMTAELFAELLKKHGLTLVTQFDSWGRHEQYHVPIRGDVITVFKK
jgi:ubiquinone/menaquinone biosynthesis C-methylase UbiE